MMAQPLCPRPFPGKYYSWIVHFSLVLSLIAQIKASPYTVYSAKEEKLEAGGVSTAQENLQILQLEPGKPIERELSGGESHSYQLTLAAGQYVDSVVEQRGIDVSVKLFAPDGKQIGEFDSERRTQGLETAWWVAEEEGSYRLDVQAEQKGAAAGTYKIQVVELHLATENERALYETVKLNTEFLRLYTAGRYDEARERVLGAEHPEVVASIKAEPFYQHALAIREKVLGPEHPFVAYSLNDLARLYLAKGDIAQAVAFLSRANAVDEHNLVLTLSLGSERHKFAYLSFFSQRTDLTLSLQSQIAPDNPQALVLAFTTLLRRKARALDAMTDAIATLRRHATPEDREWFKELAAARTRLAEFALKEPDAAKSNSYRKKIEELEAEVDKLEAMLSYRSVLLRAQTQPVTLAAVQAALPPVTALVEFAFFTPLDPKTEKNKPPRYLAYLLSPQGQPRWADLGEAAPIDRAVDAWRKALRDPNRTDVKRLARSVDKRVMQPVRALLNRIPGHTRRLLIAPDGSLNLIPFAALVDERNRFLVERYSITYLTSGRDLLRLQTSEPSKSHPLVLANPLFGRDEINKTPRDQATVNSLASNQAGIQASAQSDQREIFFQALPGTRREALAIKDLLPEASLLLQEDATEAALKRAHAPSILHIATHGFFLEERQAPPEDKRGLSGDQPLRISDPGLTKWAARIENPLLRSGLALAGVNKQQNGDGDGLLTALEAASLDLWGTKLVVLSACDTGVGEVMNGEGVYGLRRALVLAGSETQVISLWSISDRETRGLMAGYYGRLQKGEGRGEALREIQLEMLKGLRLRHPYYWASFIQAGEWANLKGKR